MYYFSTFLLTTIYFLCKLVLLTNSNSYKMKTQNKTCIYQELYNSKPNIMKPVFTHTHTHKFTCLQHNSCFKTHRCTLRLT